MTSVAFIKLAGKNATVESPSIVLNPGKISILSIMQRCLNFI
jgi:hypothetical protein